MAMLAKWRNRVDLLFTPIFFFIIANLAFAETKVFVEEYTYQASEADSKLSSRIIALEQVKRLLLEKLGTYLESEVEVKNFQLTKDQIVTLTAGVVRAEIIDEKWDGKTYSLKAQITADPKEVIKSIDHLRQDREETKELEEMRKKASEAIREIERLRNELEIAKVGKAEKDRYQGAVNSLSATDWLEKGRSLWIAGQYQESKRAFNRSIELDPKGAEAYSARGAAYFNLGNYRDAIEDYDRAIELNPKYEKAYYNRGTLLVELGNYRQAIKDFDAAIELDQKYAWAYSNRGSAYSKVQNFRQAIKDFDTAIELDPRSALAYYGRGIAKLNLGNYREAIEDFDKAIELNPKYANAYNNRGVAYHKLGDYRRDIEDFKSGARLGSKEAQDFLRSKGINW